MEVRRSASLSLTRCFFSASSKFGSLVGSIKAANVRRLRRVAAQGYLVQKDIMLCESIDRLDTTKYMQDDDKVRFR